MNNKSHPSAASRTLRFGGIGWILLLLGVMIVAVLARHLPRLIRAIELTESGGPTEANLNGFTLDPILIDREELGWFSAADEVHPIDTPQLITVEETLKLGHRFLVDTSIVIGVVIGGQARAYPERVVQVHEVVNDTVGGVAIAIVHQPLIGLSAVFRRPLDGSLPVLLGNSGLVVDSCPLLHDRLGANRRSEETLWSPLRAEAVAGVGVKEGKTLELVPHRRISWRNWREEHPEGRVLAMEASHKSLYRKEPFNTYRFRGAPRFPVSPLPDETSSRALFARMLVVPLGDRTLRVCLDEVIPIAATGGVWQPTDFPGIKLVTDAASGTAYASGPEGELLPAIEAYWFACFAHRDGGRATGQ
ncbi:MAG TPA: DUF3179 domain-containing protein [Planctomycetes bacterium]|nr:DUF3179 domain-containing protein [Planctomycetota bacterium]HIN80282.1 DUF3179 domain-containing protein [Planctomycetota bacterium]